MNRGDAVQFPLGLCGTLVIAGALAAFPRWAEPLAHPARWLMCLPLRAWPQHTVAAATVESGAEPGAGMPSSVIAAQARQRLAEEAVRGAAEPLGQPLICRVLERRGRGPADLPTLLVLDRPWDEVEGCSGLVTRGDQLVGFLGRREDVEDALARTHAVVRCVHAPPRRGPPRRLLAATSIAGASLGFVVEPSSRIDPWPLRVGLIEDPYLASRMGAAGAGVQTAEFASAGVAVPAGLGLGTLRVWGYAERGGPVVPVAFYVEPGFDPRAIGTVVLWRPVAHPAPDRAAAVDEMVCMPARGALFPGGQRLFLLTVGGQAEPGAAVITPAGHLFGVVDEAGPGDAVARAFTVPGRSWPLLLLPEEAALPPIECAGKVVAVAGEVVELRLEAAISAFRGDVLTGANGLHCPAGLWVGRVEEHEGGATVRIIHPRVDLSAVSVCVRAGRMP